jgi:hypothetical protein
LIEALDEPPDFGRAMLAVAVHLHRHVITMQGGIAIAGLHRAADPKIKWQAHDHNTDRHLPNGVVGGAVIDHQHIKARQRPP